MNRHGFGTAACPYSGTFDLFLRFGLQFGLPRCSPRRVGILDCPVRFRLILVGNFACPGRKHSIRSGSGRSSQKQKQPEYEHHPTQYLSTAPGFSNARRTSKLLLGRNWLRCCYRHRFRRYPAGENIGEFRPVPVALPDREIIGREDASTKLFEYRIFVERA